MSDASVLRPSRMRPQDIISNIGEGAEWIAEAHGLPLADVQTVLAFQAAHRNELPIGYFPQEYIAEMGADRIDWSACQLIDNHSGNPAICFTPVRPIDLIAHEGEGEERLTYSYSLPLDTVQAVLRYYHQHKRQLAPAV